MFRWLSSVSVSPPSGDRRTSTSVTALGAALARPWADVVLSGAATFAQLESNLAALGAIPSQSELEKRTGMAEEPSRYWAWR